MSEKTESNHKQEVVRKGHGRQLIGFEETEHSKKWKEPFFFVQAADTQLGMIVNYGDGTIEVINILTYHGKKKSSYAGNLLIY